MTPTATLVAELGLIALNAYRTYTKSQERMAQIAAGEEVQVEDLLAFEQQTRSGLDRLQAKIDAMRAGDA